MRSHDFDVGLPVELVVDEDPEVAYQRRSTNLKGPAARNWKVDQRPEGANMYRVGSTGLECDEFRFIRVEAEAVV